jgi:DNA-directed RNA polymerase subunit RPC12/RpoP
MVNIPDIERYTCARCGETFLDLDNETKIDGYLQTRRTRTKTATTRSP